MQKSRVNLEEIRKQALMGGGQEKIDKQHEKGKLTARERIDYLLDPGSFTEIGSYVTHRATGLGMEKNHPWGDGVITGMGKIEGRPIYIICTGLYHPRRFGG